MALFAEPFIRNKRRNKRQRLHIRADINAAIEDNPLPSYMNWNELNVFLRDTQYGQNMPGNFWFMLDWEIQPCVKEGLKGMGISCHKNYFAYNSGLRMRGGDSDFESGTLMNENFIITY